MMKKIFSLFLTVCLMLSFSTTIFVSAATQYSYSQAKALEYAANHWNDGVGLCAEFVWNCVKAGGINISKKTGTRSCFNGILDNSCATRYQLKLNSSGRAMQTDNASILSPGDVVVQYCTTCDLYPHIMLFSKFDSNGNALYYAHNGAMNNGKYTLNKNSQHKSTCNIIAYVAHFPQNNNGGSSQGVDENGTQTEEKKQIVAAEASSLKINITEYPETIIQGSSFKLRGDINSNYNVTSVIGTIVDLNGKNHGTTIESPAEKSNDIQYLHLGKSMDFSKLEIGNYTLNIEALDSSGNKKTWSKDFVVKAEEPDSTLSINLTNCPSSIDNGESVRLSGTVSSNYLIKEVKAVIFDTRGFGYYPTTIYPNSKSVRIENTDLSDGIYFEGLPGGAYTLEITAKDEKTTKSIAKIIKISERIIEEEDDDLYSADIDIEINNNKNIESTKNQKCGNNAYWNFDNGVLTISGSGKMNDYSSPWELPWYDIQSDVRKIVIEEGITYIGNNAFCWYGANSNNAININEIYIPSTIEGLGNCTFAYVDGVDTVYYNARNCEFTGISLTFAYNYFARGTTLVIGKDVERIGANVFYRGQFDEVVCIGDWETISTDMTGNEVLECIETENNDGEIVVKVDGRKVKFDQPPIIQDGRTLVPVRAACEAMGINVEWIESEQRIVLTKYGEEFDMQIGNKKYWMNQVSHYYFDVSPQIINGRTLIPIRAIAQFFGYNVDWNEDTQSVIIESE